MKKLSLIALMFFTTYCNAQNFYISPTGSDAANGSQATPWKTLSKATSTVTAGTINVLPGTYIESVTSNLKSTVNLVGTDTTTTIIKSSIAGDWSTLLNLESSTFTNGNQIISGITFDGQYVNESNFKTWICIWVTYRSNVIINGCKIINFYDRGVILNGTDNNNSTIAVDPKLYSSGNKIINCFFSNTSRNSSNYIAGQINIGAQKDCEISNNKCIQLQRPAGKNGELIKYWGSGYNVDCKILNNVLKRLNFSSNQYNGSGDWNFAIELFWCSGIEIAGNQIQGSLDINYNRKNTSAYSMWVHDNVFDHNPANTKEENGMVIEFEASDFIIENNKFFNQAIGITFNIRTPNENGGYNNPVPVGGNSAVVNGVIRNNLFANLYSSYSYGNCCGSAGIQWYTENETKDGYIRNVLITDNTFVNLSGHATNTGIDLTHFVNGTSPRTDGITITRNIFVGFTDTYLLGGGSKMINTITSNNDIWQCGNSNNPNWTGSLVNTGNTSVNPNLDANYVSTLPIGYKTSGTPPISCTGYVYSDYVCNTQTGIKIRTVVGYTPTGCTGTPNFPPVLTDTCSIIPQPCVFVYSDWGPCDSITGTQTRTVLSVSPSNCVGTPILSRSCSINNPPIVSVKLSMNNITLSATATDSDGTISSYKWTKVSGGSCTIKTPNAATTSVTGLKAGTYIFKVDVKDNSGSITTKTITVNN